MGAAPDLEIRPLIPELIWDYLSFLGAEAFADNPRWASCFCFFHHAPHRLQRWRDRTGEESREPRGSVGSIVCFVVAQPFRGQGIARRLLEAACEGFRARGMEVAEGYPRKEAVGEAANHTGPLALFLQAGFEIYHQDEGTVVVRKRLS